MKTKIALALVGSFGIAHGAVTIGFSTGTNAAEGWQNSSGSKNAAMMWGLIVDTAGDGFDGFESATGVASDGGLLITGGATYQPGFTRRGTSGTNAITGGQFLNVSGAATDDLLFLSGNLMAIVSSEARMTTISAINYGTGTNAVTAGDRYALVWFDYTSFSDSVTVGNDMYGAWTKFTTPGTTVTNSTVMPGDPGSYTTSTGPAGLFGADNAASSKLASLTLVPEPSAALLGALGALGLLRRRRN